MAACDHAFVTRLRLAFVTVPQKQKDLLFLKTLTSSYVHYENPLI